MRQQEQLVLMNAPDFIEDDYDNINDAVFSIPVKSPVGEGEFDPITRNESALDILKRVKRFSIRWIQRGHRKGTNTHNVSATINIRDDEWDGVGEWMWMNRHYYNGLSVFPFDGGGYKQPPHEAIDKERYLEMEHNFPQLDFTSILEDDDFTDFTGEIACAGGACEI